MMQISMFGAQLSLESELKFDIEKKRLSPYGHFFIDLLSRADFRLLFITNTSSVPSKSYSTKRFK